MDGYRKIIHVDMDAFYASVEQRDNPELRGKPIAVGRDEARSVVATASYEARRFGVHSAMASSVARRLCPELIFVHGRYDVYETVSEQVHEIFHEYTDLVEPLSLDEAFLDVTDNKVGEPLAVEIAKQIKQKIRSRLNLVASAGVSYNKFLAKIASDYRKPDGLYTIHPARAIEFINSLKVEQMWGVGPVTARKMHQLGIYSGGQLREFSLDFLTRAFGKMGKVYYDFARGIDERPVVPDRVRKSLGCERTLEKDINERIPMLIELYHVVVELVRRLKEHGFRGNCLTLKVKFYDFSQITRSVSVDHDLRKKDDILPLAKSLLAQVPYASRPVRLLGLSVSQSGAMSKSKSDLGVQLELGLEF